MESKLMAHFYSPKLMDFLLVCRLLCFIFLFALVCVFAFLWCRMRNATNNFGQRKCVIVYPILFACWIMARTSKLFFDFQTNPSPFSFALVMACETQCIAVLRLGDMVQLPFGLHARQSILRWRDCCAGLIQNIHTYNIRNVFMIK